MEPKNKQKSGRRRPLPAHLKRVEEIIEPAYDKINKPVSLVPGRHHSVMVGGIIQESLGGIIPLQTGGFVGIGSGVLIPCKFTVWTRLILPNGKSIVMERQAGSDAAGYSGLQDGVV